MQLFKIAGIGIELHWTFLALLALVFFAGGISSLILLFMLFTSVILHELSHSLVARSFGVSVKKIVLLPIGGMAMIDEFAMSPKVELLVSAAGPIFSLALAIFAFGVEIFSPFPELTVFAAAAKEANVLLCAFNLLPAIPLDGGRVWRALRQRNRSFLSATREAVKLSKFTVFAIMLFGMSIAVFTDSWGFLFWNAIIALFIFIGADMELDAAVFKESSSGIKVRDAMTRDIVLASGDETLQDALELAYSSKVRNLLIVGKHGYGVVPVAAFARVPRKDWGKVKTKSIAAVPLKCSPEDSVLDVWKSMRTSHVELAPVVEKGKLTGVVTETDIERLIYIRRLALIS